jgi:hypothetical protein
MIKLSGKIREIFPTESFGQFEKKFEKRVIWLEEVAEKYANTYSLELWGTDCPMADSYNVGDYVTCYIDIKGKFYEKNGKEGVINSLKCWNFEKDGKSYKESKPTAYEAK